MLQLLRELCLLLHVARFLFASPIPHFLANVIDSILIHRVVLLEEAYSLLTIAAVVAISTTATVATTPRTTFVWVLGTSSVMTLARKAWLVNRHNLWTLLAFILWFEYLRNILLCGLLLSLWRFPRRSWLTIEGVDAVIHIVWESVTVGSSINGSQLALIDDLHLHFIFVKVLGVSVVFTDYALVHHAWLAAAIFHLVHALLHAFRISPLHWLVLNNCILQGFTISGPARLRCFLPVGFVFFEFLGPVLCSITVWPVNCRHPPQHHRRCL